MASFRTIGLTKHFGDLRAVNEIDLDLLTRRAGGCNDASPHGPQGVACRPFGWGHDPRSEAPSEGPVAVTPTVKLLERSVVSGLVAGAALGGCFMLGLAVLEILSGHATELELVPVAVAAAAVVGAVVGAPVGLVAGLGARAPLARGNLTVARVIVASVGAIGAGATLSVVYGPLGLWGDCARLGAAVAVVMLGAAVAGWFLASLLLRPHD